MWWYFIVLVVVVVVFVINHFKRKNRKKFKENFENVSINIGNILCVYYYKYFISLLKKEHFYYENNDSFINLFPKFIQFDQEISNLLDEKKITYEKYKNYDDVSFWGSETKEKQIIHDIMKPYMNKIMTSVFEDNKLKKEVKYPIIHFRCADTPFIKQRHYYLQKYKYFKDVLESVPKFDKIIILSCNTHLSSKKNEESCGEYTHLLKDQLKEYNPEIECGTNVDDFISMFYAPVVISTQSSFSFMAGFFGNGTYIQPNFMDENKECNDCESKWRGYSISHEMVDDYHQIKEVYKLLI
jgi:hypothetical protein